MQKLLTSSRQHLPAIVQCHMQCFPDSLATRLGEAYVQQTFDWYLDQPKRFLFHIEQEGEVIGYCGGFVPSKPGDGSSSGMLQHAFNQALRGLLLKPWLLLHAEVRPHYPFLWRNIKRRLTGKIVPAKPATSPQHEFKTYCGLVVIGVLPEFRGRGVAGLLMNEFEERAINLNQSLLILSVKKANTSAIAAYKKNGWQIGEAQKLTYVMRKQISL